MAMHVDDWMPDAGWMRRFRTGLTRWFGQNARDLPWRRTADPYPIWISEIMLQQTTVAAVVPYFERFVARFPTVEALAAAHEEDVLRLWEGLGYYSRARNIHRAAQKIVAESGGRFPDSPEELQALPGIGRYTAGAIASFAFDRRAPIVEANTLRVYCRLLGYDGDPRSAAGQKLLWAFAEHVLPRRFPGRFNQAMMELGATLCSPDAPDCEACPVRTCCAAFADGTQADVPRPAARPKVTDVTEATVAVRREGAYLLMRRSEGQRWAGLWDFPRFELDRGKAVRRRRLAKNGGAAVSASLRRRLEEEVAAQTGVTPAVEHLLTEIRHSVTRYRITLECYHATFRDGECLGGAEEMRWVCPADFDELPFSMTGRKLAQLLAEQDQGTPI